ncbi:MAG TPA: amidohydrolase [Candidatus Limnocylindrales bacterium]|nr:amidohydrolase [Candidatus Limnocylindrales bacterium]
MAGPLSATILRGRIATLAGEDGPAWVEAIGIEGGRVVAAGALDDVRAALPASAIETRLREDEAALPGLTDSHLHLAEVALAAVRVDLADAATLDAGLRRVAAAAGDRAEGWIEGKGWDADRWGRWPTAADLERVAPGRAVALWAHDHHALWVSAEALRRAGVDRERADPDGGVIRRDEHGEPTGVLHESAARLVMSRVPRPEAATIARAVTELVPQLLALGVVALHDPGALSLETGLGTAIAAYRSLAADGRLGLRVHACIRPEQLDTALGEGHRSGAPLGEDPLGRLRFGWLKCFADGTLGSRTAALIEPLAAVPGEPLPPNDGFGVWMTEPAELAALAQRAAGGGIGTIIHAIGDQAVRASLDALAPTVGRSPVWPRLEHVQLVGADDLGRFAAAGVAASVQPVHVRSDAAKARHLWGARAEERGYPFGALDASGALVCFGTDAPVEPIDPWPGLACAVTRAAPTWPPGTPPFGPAHAMPLWRAIRAAICNPARSAGEPDRGRLVPGQRADVVVVPLEALAEPVAVGGALWSARPTRVLLDGEVVFER